ncbi:hypothetical protein [Nonomuraea longicatena]|uniref:HTH cro/C1-type domain-containing protein n=1 Tax=Nonomuraea longicatena TaxID=83682 RepID=A0ABN1PZE7_9ACTN
MARTERPLDEGDGPLVDFAAELRGLRRRAGNPTYRALASKAHFSATTLSEAAAGRRLPSLQVTLAYVRACGGDAEQWEARWHELSGRVAAGDASPYAGLAAFQPEDAARFHGRERLAAEIAERMRSRPLVAVFGASGAGKSSLLRAGVIPLLHAEGPVALLTPGAHPLEELRRTFDKEPKVLVVDQFEEVFTLCAPAERAEFLAELLAVTGTGEIRAVLGVRADFYAHCSGHSGLVEAMRDAQVTVGPMTADELRRAVTRPAADAGCTLEGALLTTLIAQAAGRAGVLPLLSHALVETWVRRRGTVLTLAGFEAAGGIGGALTRTAEAVYTSFDEVGRSRARDLFLRLTALGDGTGDTKRRIRREEVAGMGPGTTEVVERLAAARLLTLDTEHVEVAHEVLIGSWPRLRSWLDADRDGLRAHRALTEAAAAWLALARDPGALYRGARLSSVREWLNGPVPGGALTASEQEFVKASASAEERETTTLRRTARQLRVLVTALSVMLVLAGAAVVAAVRAQDSASAQRNEAVSQQLAVRAGTLRQTDPALAAQLGLAGYRIAPTVAARSALLSTFAAPYATRLAGHDGGVESVTFNRDGTLIATSGMDRTARLWDGTDPYHPRELATLPGHTGNVSDVAFAPREHLLITGSDDRTARLWDVRDRRRPVELATLTGHTGAVLGVAFDSSGRLAATAGGDGVIRLWDVADPRRPTPKAELTGHTGPVDDVLFADGDRMLLTAGWDRTIGVWDVSDPARPGPPILRRGHTDVVNSLSLSPDGTVLASTSPDRTVRLWRVNEPAQAAFGVLEGHTDHARTAAFSPDGRTLATTSHDRTVHLWDLSDPRHPRRVGVLTGHTEFVISAAFSPDGRVLATAGNDRLVRLWHLPLPALAAHRDSVYGLAYHPGTGLLASAGYDRTVRLWDTGAAVLAETATLSGHTDAVNSVAFSPGGRLLASGSADRTVRLWQVGTPPGPVPLTTLTGHTDAVNAVAFAAGGRVLASASADFTVRLWDVSDPARVTRLSTTAGPVQVRFGTVGFSPDGGRLAAAGSDGQLLLWDVADPRQPLPLPSPTARHGDTVKALAFSPDGRMLASASADHTVRLWDLPAASAPVPLATLRGHTDTVHALAFSPGGRLLASASADRTVRLWDLSDPAQPGELAVFTDPRDRVYAVSVAPDGSAVAAGGQDRVVYRWDLDTRRATARICAVSAVSRADWAQYLPGQPFQPPCGGG